MTTKTRVDAYQIITDKVIAMIETHGANWTRPWASAGVGGAPVSVSTGDQYRGINRLMLGMSGFGDARWGTYNAWKAKGAQVRKGERGTQVLFFKPLSVTDRATGDERTIPMAKVYTVFNAEQVDGAPAVPAAAPMTPKALYDHCEQFIAATGAVVRIGGDSACYSPVTDVIKCPHVDQFADVESYYGTLLHELTHWTGHKSRNDRDLLNKFGSADYAREELVAEMGAAFLCADLGLEPEPRADHAQYIAGWLKALRDDKRLIVKAAKQAQLAADYIHGLQATEITKAA